VAKLGWHFVINIVSRIDIPFLHVAPYIAAEEMIPDPFLEVRAF
jgi:hypothetical protein